MATFRITALYLLVTVWMASLCLFDCKHTPAAQLRRGGTHKAPQPRNRHSLQGDPVPCKIEHCGPCPEGDITFSPNPPEVDEDLFVNISLIAPTDIWYLTAKGNVTMGKSFVRRFDENVCDLKEDFCPIKKGEKIGYTNRFFLSSILIQKTTVSGWVELVNQDDVHIGCYFIKNCLLV